jgi:hypothetical protein
MHEGAVALVEDDPEVACDRQLRETDKSVAVVDGACRVGRSVDDDRARFVRNGRRDVFNAGNVAIAARVDEHGSSAGDENLSRERRPVRRGNDDLVTGIEQHHCGVEQRLLGAGGDCDLVGLPDLTGLKRNLLRQRLAQFDQTDRVGVAVDALVDGADRAVADGWRKIAPDLAGGQIDDFLAGVRGCLCRCARGSRARRFEQACPLRKHVRLLKNQVVETMRQPRTAAAAVMPLVAGTALPPSRARRRPSVRTALRASQPRTRSRRCRHPSRSWRRRRAWRRLRRACCGWPR